MKRRRDRAEIQLSPLSFPTWRCGPKGPPLRFSGKWTGCTHRGKRCSLQSVSGNAETTCTSVTCVRQQQHPSGHPARPAICGSHRKSTVSYSVKDRRGLNSTSAEIHALSFLHLEGEC